MYYTWPKKFKKNLRFWRQAKKIKIHRDKREERWAAMRRTLQGSQKKSPASQRQMETKRSKKTLRFHPTLPPLPSLPSLPSLHLPRGPLLHHLSLFLCRRYSTLSFSFESVFRLYIFPWSLNWAKGLRQCPSTTIDQANKRSTTRIRWYTESVRDGKEKEEAYDFSVRDGCADLKLNGLSFHASEGGFRVKHSVFVFRI